MDEKKTILVVDDFTTIRKFVCETLQRKGYLTMEAASGSEACEIIENNATQIDLVLTDYTLPDCTGNEFLTRVKARNATAAIPVVFVSTETKVNEIKPPMEPGLVAWIRKPYRADTFFATIQQALEYEK